MLVSADPSGPRTALNIKLRAYASVTDQFLDIQFTGDYSLAELCQEPFGTNATICPYVLKGSSVPASGSSNNECCPTSEILVSGGLPTGHRRRHLAVASESSTDTCTRFEGSSAAACYSLQPIEQSESWEMGTTLMFEITRIADDDVCPEVTEFHVVLQQQAISAVTSSGAIWDNGVPAVDHLSWPLERPWPVYTPRRVSFVVADIDRVGQVCTVDGQDACTFRLVSSSGCFVGTVASDFVAKKKRSVLESVSLESSTFASA